MQREGEETKFIYLISDSCISWPDVQGLDTEWVYPPQFFLTSVAPKQKQWFGQEKKKIILVAEFSKGVFKNIQNYFYLTKHSYRIFSYEGSLILFLKDFFKLFSSPLPPITRVLIFLAGNMSYKYDFSDWCFPRICVISRVCYFRVVYREFHEQNIHHYLSFYPGYFLSLPLRDRIRIFPFVTDGQVPVK